MCIDENGAAGTEAVCTLTIEAGQLHVRRPGDDKSVAATIAYLRPLSARSEITFLDSDSHEILSVDSLDQLARSCQKLARAELATRYHLPRIAHVNSIDTVFGMHYWKVETDKGPCEFVFKEPGKNVTQLSPTHIILRDTIGNRYEIPSITTLDAHSQRQINKIL